MAAKRKKKQGPKQNGWVYVIKIWLKGEVLLKIGTTNRNPNTRAIEIATQCLELFGEIPRMRVVGSKQVRENYAVEKELLDRTAKYTFVPDERLHGYSEFRRMGEVDLLKEFTNCVNKAYPAVKPPELICM